jgi:hypothetical protein
MFVPVTISRIDDENASYTGDFLVDTESRHSIVPKGVIELLDARVEGVEELDLAGGGGLPFPFVLLRIEVMGKVTGGRVFAGPDTAPAILVMTVLRSLGFVVDPKSQRLRSQPLWLKGTTDSGGAPHLAEQEASAAIARTADRVERVGSRGPGPLRGMGRDNRTSPSARQEASRLQGLRSERKKDT